MTNGQLRYSKEEFTRRGNEIYNSQVRPHVEEGNHGKIVAIDIETGAFEVAKDSLTASDQLLANHPDAQIWFVRIGYRAVHRIGFAGSTIPEELSAIHRLYCCCLKQDVTMKQFP